MQGAILHICEGDALERDPKDKDSGVPGTVQDAKETSSEEEQPIESFRDFFTQPVPKRFVEPWGDDGHEDMPRAPPEVSVKQQELEADLAGVDDNGPPPPAPEVPKTPTRPPRTHRRRASREVVDKAQRQLKQGLHIEARQYVKWVVDQKGHLVLDKRDSPAEGYVLATDIPSPPKTPRDSRGGRAHSGSGSPLPG